MLQRQVKTDAIDEFQTPIVIDYQNAPMYPSPTPSPTSPLAGAPSPAGTPAAASTSAAPASHNRSGNVLFYTCSLNVANVIQAHKAPLSFLSINIVREGRRNLRMENSRRGEAVAVPVVCRRSDSAIPQCGAPLRLSHHEQRIETDNDGRRRQQTAAMVHDDERHLSPISALLTPRRNGGMAEGAVRGEASEHDTTRGQARKHFAPGRLRPTLFQSFTPWLDYLHETTISDLVTASHLVPARLPSGALPAHGLAATTMDQALASLAAQIIVQLRHLCNQHRFYDVGYVYGTGKPLKALNKQQDLGVKVASPVGTLVGQLLFGYLADRLGRKKIWG
ncbi:hypothetical protein BJ912DRAFT_1062823 [Pholiota molesta]|nr:hypothetical protein BJ912DRAFT_1062823 [Pholiota molesta]